MTSFLTQINEDVCRKKEKEIMLLSTLFLLTQGVVNPNVERDNESS